VGFDQQDGVSGKPETTFSVPTSEYVGNGNEREKAEFHCKGKVSHRERRQRR